MLCDPLWAHLLATLESDYLEEGSGQATSFHRKRIRRGRALRLGCCLDLSSDSTSEMCGGTCVSWCMHPDCSPQVSDQNEDMREGWGLEEGDLTHSHWQPLPPPWASFPQIKSSATLTSIPAAPPPIPSTPSFALGLP